MNHPPYSHFWQVLRLKPRQDKKAAAYFEKIGLEYYLPIQQQLHNWSDRKKWVDVPVLSPYIFVKTNSATRNLVFGTNAVLHYVRYNNDYAQVSDTEIEGLKEICRGNEKLSFIEQQFVPGQMVEIRVGLMAGKKAEIHEARKNKMILSIEGLGSFISCEIEKRYCPLMI